jgi:ribose transport system permease protein
MKSQAGCGELSLLNKLIRSEYFVLLLCGAWAAVACVVAPEFASQENLVNVIASMIPLLIVAVGQTVVVLTGGIDLSATSVIALASVTGALTMTSVTSGGGGTAALLGAGVMLVTGMLAGVANGAAVAWLRMPPFIVTLTTMMFVSGLALWTTKSSNVPGIPEAFFSSGSSLLVVAPLALVSCAICHWVLTRTRMGQWLYAAGRNLRTAVASGVPVGRTLVFAYMLSGLFAALSSVIYTARLETGSPVLGQRLLLDVVAAVVIGGTSLFGGRGRVLWTVWGVLFITLIDNTLNLIGVSNFAVLMVKGIVIVCAALLDRARSLRAAV